MTLVEGGGANEPQKQSVAVRRTTSGYDVSFFKTKAQRPRGRTISMGKPQFKLVVSPDSLYRRALRYAVVADWTPRLSLCCISYFNIVFPGVIVM